MNKKHLSVALCAAFFAGAGLAKAEEKAKKPAAPAKKAAPAAKSESVNLMSGWSDAWPDGTMTGAKATLSEGALTVSGTADDKSYGSVYKKMNVDLDKTPYLVVDAATVNGFWYVIVKNVNIKGGFAKAQPDTNSTGKQIYNLKAVTGLSGRRDLELEIGISSGKEDPNAGKSVVLKAVRFAAQEPGAFPGALAASPWKDKWPDGKPTGASVKQEGDQIVLTGTAKDRSYGSAFRIVSVNLDRTPFLRVTPAKVSGVWYLEAMGGNLKAPVKIQADTDSLETKNFELKTLLGLDGEQTFELHFGVGSGKEEPNLGKQAVIGKDLAFQSGTGESQ